MKSHNVSAYHYRSRPSTGGVTSRVTSKRQGHEMMLAIWQTILKCYWAGHFSAAMSLVGVLGVASCVGDSGALECVPFARARSGVQLHGPAADWWPGADGRYIRTSAPVVGSVLVFRRTSRLPNGHVAVVTRVLSERQILVSHANWVHHRVSENVSVIDVSPNNNWTMVRVWWPPSNQMGITTYPTYGFILSGSVTTT
jgi:surface antigen